MAWTGSVRVQMSRPARAILLALVLIMVTWKYLGYSSKVTFDNTHGSQEKSGSNDKMYSTDEPEAKLKDTTGEEELYSGISEDGPDNEIHSTAKLEDTNEEGGYTPTQEHQDIIEAHQELSTSAYETNSDEEATTVDSNTVSGDSQSSKGMNEEEYTPSQQDQENDESLGSMPQPNASATGCSPHHHIMFLKTHKCASTTVQNILLRYAYQHNLTVALSSGHYLGHPKLFNYHMMNRALLPSSGHADIFTLHSRLNIPEHQKAMHPDAKWITIVRDPVEQYPSLFLYYELDKLYKKDFETFLKQPIEVLRNAPRYKGKQGKNTVLFDLGYPDTIPPEKLDEVIHEIDNLFHYVMISDRMDESLILLRNELCWTNHDIMGFTKNARVHGNDKLPKELADKISEMNMEDTAIYKHFLNKHTKAVEMFGVDKMAEEVSELEKLRKEYYDNCVAEEVQGHDKRLSHKEFRGNVNAFLPVDNNETCKLITMGELQMVEFVRKHQYDLIKRLRLNN